MQTIEEVKGHCKFAADGIAKAVEECAELGAEKSRCGSDLRRQITGRK